MGKAVVDLRREDLPDGVHVKVRAVMGEVEVQVPPGSRVHLSGMALMGERKVRLAEGAGPVVHVDAYAVMGAVNVTVGDGSVAAGSAGPAVPASRPVHQRRAGLAHRVRGRFGGLLVPVALLGAVLLAGPDSTAIFGSSVERVSDGSAQVSTLFGSVEVVVPDGARVDTSGAVLFGSVECDACDVATADGPVVSVRSFGAFGSVEIVTVSQKAEG